MIVSLFGGSLAGPEPGLTRDSVHASLLMHDGIKMDLVDTAGWVGVTRTSKYDAALIRYNCQICISFSLVHSLSYILICLCLNLH